MAVRPPLGGDAQRRYSLHYRRSDTAAAPPPCHISFLYAPSNDAMLRLLRPLLPVARVLRVRAFDLDVYARTRDAHTVAANFVPALCRFFTRFSHSADQRELEPM